MIALMYGGASSGKSRFAEDIVCAQAQAQGAPLVYLATMRPYGEAGRERVERHRAMRKGKGFATVECYGSLSQVSVDPSSVLLLECLGNLVANLQFGPDGSPIDDDAVYQEALRGFDDLASRCAGIVVVSNDVGSDCLGYDPMTRSYIEILGRLTNAVAQRSDAVYEVIAGVPVALKEVPIEIDR